MKVWSKFLRRGAGIVLTLSTAFTLIFSEGVATFYSGDERRMESNLEVLEAAVQLQEMIFLSKQYIGRWVWDDEPETVEKKELLGILHDQYPNWLKKKDYLVSLEGLDPEIISSLKSLEESFSTEVKRLLSITAHFDHPKIYWVPYTNVDLRAQIRESYDSGLLNEQFNLQLEKVNDLILLIQKGTSKDLRSQKKLGIKRIRVTIGVVGFILVGLFVLPIDKLTRIKFR